ncbi:MAG TPA: hypothetical protein VIL74_11815 [Pyrinomonadaceae bacterium]|jgi:hypothetical protein
MAEENNNEEKIPQPPPFPPEMIEDPESETVAHEVRDYLWGKGPIDYPLVSAHLKRELVSRFVAFELRELPPEFFWRVRILADLYNLREHIDAFQSYLNRAEGSPEDLDRSIACTIILQEIGDSSHKSFALQYYDYMVGHRFADERFAELIKCLAALGARANPAPLQARMQQRINALAANEAADPEAGVERRVVEELLDNEFFFVGEANQSRERIKSIADPNKRLLELIRAYLELTDDAGGKYFELWVQQQIRRAAERDGAPRVIDGFRFAARAFGEMNKSDQTFGRVRTVNAIEFFLGKPTPEEEEYMIKYRQTQIDPLRYMPVPLHIHEPEEIEEEEELDEEEDESENEK